jgi:hypothetical protein
VRTETARFILSEPAASEARYFAGFAPRQAHGDTAVRSSGLDTSPMPLRCGRCWLRPRPVVALMTSTI